MRTIVTFNSSNRVILYVACLQFSWPFGLQWPNCSNKIYEHCQTCWLLFASHTNRNNHKLTAISSIYIYGTIFFVVVVVVAVVWCLVCFFFVEIPSLADFILSNRLLCHIFLYSPIFVVFFYFAVSLKKKKK